MVRGSVERVHAVCAGRNMSCSPSFMSTELRECRLCPRTPGRPYERFWRSTSADQHTMLLNTSLNIKGQPMVNDAQDAEEFEARYRVRVF